MATQSVPRIVATECRNARNRKTGEWTARLDVPDVSPWKGFQSQTRATKEAAIADVVEALAFMADHEQTRRYVWCADGETVMVLYPIAGQWAYDIMDRSRAYPCYVPLGRMSLEAAYAKMLRHAEAFAPKAA